MNVTGHAAVPVPSSSSSPCNSVARHYSPADVRLLHCAFHSYQHALPAECAVPFSALGLQSSFAFFSHWHPRHTSSKKLLVVRAQIDSGFLRKRAPEDPASKWVLDGREPPKPQEKAWRDFRSSPNHHTSSGSDVFSPNNHQGAVSPSRTPPTLTGKQQTRDIDRSAASRLQNRLPAFKQAAEPDAFGAAYAPLHGADAFSRFNGQGPPSNGGSAQMSSSLKKGSSSKESVFTSKLEEILNKFRAREKQSSSRDDLSLEVREDGAAPSALQDYTKHNGTFVATRSKAHRPQANGDGRSSKNGPQNSKYTSSIHQTSFEDDDFDKEENLFPLASAEQRERDSRGERRSGMGNGKAGVVSKADGALSNPYAVSSRLPWEGQRSPASKIQSPIRKGSSYFAGMSSTKFSPSSEFGKNQTNLNSESHDGHRISSIKKPWKRGQKPGEGGKHSKQFSMSQKEHNSDVENHIVSEFEWTDSDEEDNEQIGQRDLNLDAKKISVSESDQTDSGKENDNKQIVPSCTLDHGGSYLYSKSTNQPSLGSSMNSTSDSTVSTTKGKTAAWHKHSNPDLPFEFQYSYSETPKARIIRYREAPYSPFGPDTMGRPWTGRAPLKKSTKKLPEFDSFNPPPAGKKGIKHVQAPGPFPEGRSPIRARSREEILGEPLSGEEIVELIDQCRNERRQLNLGRDGLTHNMLDLIHCHWKRRRVVKIKSLGIPTVDMDNVCFHLEDKTGGKIIYRTGGIVYLFRGRNYNYKDRPNIPIMLWKPISPVYPRLIKRAPVGLTVEEADKLRQLGKKVEPLRTLSKNGVYLTLVKDVRAAFKIDDLVRLDCRGLNPSDYKKIGAKLRDLVPCVLLSFDDEQILMWKGKIMPSTGVDVDTSNTMEGAEVEATRPLCAAGKTIPSACVDAVTSNTVEGLNVSEVEAARPVWIAGPTDLNTIQAAVKEPSDDTEDESRSGILESKQQALVIDTTIVSTEIYDCGISARAEVLSDNSSVVGSFNQNTIPQLSNHDARLEDSATGHEKRSTTALDSQISGSRRYIEFGSMNEQKLDEQTVHKTALTPDEFSTKQEKSQDVGAGKEGPRQAPVVRVDALWDQAIESGMAIQLDEMETDSDIIIKKATELGKAVPTVIEYTLKLQSKLRPKKPKTPRPPDDLRIHFANLHKAKFLKKAAKRASRRTVVDVPDGGGLPVDELARLLSMK